MEAWMWTGGALLVGIVTGAALGYWWQRRRHQGPEMQTLVEENRRYRQMVTDHFVETARLINQMTDSYKAVFDHLSEGAAELVDTEQLSRRLAIEDREVRLHRIGARGARSDEKDDSGKASGSAEAGRDEPR
ncbi:MAG: hypothetical protein Kow0020_10270 [Wenzhouxiangellaceae bacterium]